MTKSSKVVENPITEVIYFNKYWNNQERNVFCYHYVLAYEMNTAICDIAFKVSV